MEAEDTDSAGVCNSLGSVGSRSTDWRAAEGRRGGLLKRANEVLHRCCAVAVAVVVLVLGGVAHAARWGVRDYVAAGVPDLSRRWSTSDLRTAVDAITRAAAGHPERLPRYHDARSGAVFAKLLEPTPEDRSAAVDVQVDAHFQRYRALADAGDLYGAIAQRSMPREWIELYGVVLREAAALEQLSEPFITAVKPGDSRLPERHAMIAKLRDGTGKMLMLQLVVAIAENVAVSERMAAVHNLTEAAPTLLPTIAPRVSRAIRRDVATLARATRGELHEAVVSLQAAITP